MTEGTVQDSIVVEIDIDGPPAEVFEALIDPESVIDWWRDEGDGYACVSFRADPRPGGEWWSEHRGRPDQAVCILSGEYVEFERPRRIAFTWRFDSFTPEYEGFPVTTVAIDVEPHGDGSHVRLTHSGFRMGSRQVEDHRSGWMVALSHLRSWFAAHTD
jgi:uncharacterized protein YndB with AHSA1/START domain